MSRRGWLLFAALSVIWGLPYFFIKVAVGEVSPLFVVAARLALAAGLMLPWARFRYRLSDLRGYWRWLLLFAVVEMIIPFGLLSWAETRVTSSLAGLMIAAVPIVSAGAAAWLGLADRLTARRYLGLAVGAAGVIALAGLDIGTDTALAVAALFGVAVGYALGPIILNTRLHSPPGPLLMTAAITIAAAAYSPWLVVEWPRSGASEQAWASIVALGVVCTAAALLIMYALVSEAGPTRMTVITYFNPVVAVALGVLVLGEPLTAGIILGFPLILLGSLLATSRGAAGARTAVAERIDAAAVGALPGPDRH